MIALASLLFAATPLLDATVTPVFIDRFGPDWQVSVFNDTKCELVASDNGMALSVVFTQAWGGCVLDHKDAQMRSVPFSAGQFGALLFDLEADDASLNALRVYLDNGSEHAKVRPYVSGKKARIPLGALNSADAEFARIVFFNGSRAGGTRVKVDNIRFENADKQSAIKPVGPEKAISIKIDPAQKKAISPYIYGDNSWKNRQNLPFVRLGGNRWSTYNFRNNASNSGIDFGPHSNDGHLSESTEPGKPVIDFMTESSKRKAAALITVPMLDWVAADKNGLVALPAGPGNARFAANDVTNQEAFVELVEKRRGGATVFYSLDNEPGLWNSTHPLVHPEPPTYSEMADRTTRFAAMIKRKNKNAVVFGGVAYGYAELVNLQQAPDARGRDYTAFLLSAWKAAEQKEGRRVVDVFDFHWYTEVKGERGKVLDSQSREPSNKEAQARMQAPRSLWDPTYDEKTWITKVLGGPIKLLPQLQSQIDAQYPGTKIAVTEYNYGGGGHISGAIAQADVLGIFGREGVFAANLWAHGYQTGDSYTFAAFDMFLDYDGKGARVGSTSVKASTGDVEACSAYAMRESDRDLQLVLLNKSAGVLNATIDLGVAGFRSATPYVLSAAGKKAIPGDPLPLAGDKLIYKLPPYSVSTLALSR
jgi:hypothetical protein